MEPKIVTVWSNELQPKVGSCIHPENWNVGRLLKAGSEKVDSGFPGCQFYIPTGNLGPVKELACNVEITGRTIQKPFGVNGGCYVRVNIEFVGDCEPSTFTKGWMFVR